MGAGWPRDLQKFSSPTQAAVSGHVQHTLRAAGWESAIILGVNVCTKPHGHRLGRNYFQLKTGKAAELSGSPEASPLRTVFSCQRGAQPDPPKRQKGGQASGCITYRLLLGLPVQVEAQQ